MITMCGDDGSVEDFVTSGMSASQAERFSRLPNRLLFYDQLNQVDHPLRVPDFQAYIRAAGLPEFNPPIPTSPRYRLPLRADSASRQAGWHDLRGGQGRRTDLHRRGRRDPGDVRLAGGRWSSPTRAAISMSGVRGRISKR